MGYTMPSSNSSLYAVSPCVVGAASTTGPPVITVQKRGVRSNSNGAVVPQRYDNTIVCTPTANAVANANRSCEAHPELDKLCPNPLRCDAQSVHSDGEAEEDYCRVNLLARLSKRVNEQQQPPSAPSTITARGRRFTSLGPRLASAYRLIRLGQEINPLSSPPRRKEIETVCWPRDLVPEQLSADIWGTTLFSYPTHESE